MLVAVNSFKKRSKNLHLPSAIPSYRPESGLPTFNLDPRNAFSIHPSKTLKQLHHVYNTHRCTHQQSLLKYLCDSLWTCAKLLCANHQFKQRMRYLSQGTPLPAVGSAPNSKSFKDVCSFRSIVTLGCQNCWSANVWCGEGYDTKVKESLCDVLCDSKKCAFKNITCMLVFPMWALLLLWAL